MNNLIRYSHFPKNFLILLPLLLTDKLFDSKYFEDIIYSLIIFFFLTSSCYVINDYTDKDSDKINKLKKKQNLNKVNYQLSFLILFLCFLISLIIFNQYNNITIYLYLVNFLLYNFVGKKIKIIDIFLLTNFYMFRILYGFETFELELSFGFIFFCFTFFISFSILKRLIQIKENKLKKNNKILSYDLSHCTVLEKNLVSFILLNIITFFSFVLHNAEFLQISQHIFAYNYSLSQVTFIFVAYLIFVVRIINRYRKGFIKKDIYKFVLRDKFSYVVFFAIIIGMIIN
ncbi:UbiA family prenyltransferase [Pelagibacterales bacterium SAG-MED35]|nr:UbiA family prenyltransferase [Pelagibacterales bacterium SAG-MED35]